MTISVTVSPNGILQIREQVDGMPPHRRTVAPGYLDGVAFIATDVSNEPEEVRSAAVAWTPAVIAGFEAALRRDVLPVVDHNDLALLNSTLAQPGSVVRALAELQLEEANRVRGWLQKPLITKAQFVDALKAKMR